MELKFAVLVLTLLYCGLVNAQIYDVLKFGAKGDGTTDDSKAFVEAWKSMCSSGGENKTLLIPSENTFLLQPLVFQGPCKSSSVQVQFDGKIVAPINKAAWTDSETQIWVGFNGIIGLTVTGSGMIDGRGSSFWEPGLSASKRPTQLRFQGCSNLQIIGITSVNSPRNHISISNCKDVDITKIELVAPDLSPNTDGVNIADSSNVNIFDTKIGTVWEVLEKMEKNLKLRMFSWLIAFLIRLIMELELRHGRMEKDMQEI
ncbi:unnamed protein product [Thlaspi arvense]|uniref:Polygalacturonase n=1 Tax=Thlaspi arvense TaxID=13288 RepID=A0AAU9RP46_THLAR|nr:unnamed protein product [Thlaspi arvense]